MSSQVHSRTRSTRPASSRLLPAGGLKHLPHAVLGISCAALLLWGLRSEIAFGSDGDTRGGPGVDSTALFSASALSPSDQIAANASEADVSFRTGESVSTKRANDAAELGALDSSDDEPGSALPAEVLGGGDDPHRTRRPLPGASKVDQGGSSAGGGFGHDHPTDGVHQDWYSPNQLAAEGNFKDGLREGEWVGYHEDGSIRREGGYVAGKQSGRWRTYYPGGGLSSEGNYIEGQPEGIWTRWYRNGQIREQGMNDQNGLMAGPWRFFDHMGVPEARTGYYRNGRRIG